MITRELINKNIKLHDLIVLSDDDVTLRTYTYQDLSDKIDRFKTFLVSKNIKAYQNAKVCSPVTTDSTALVFALAELGLNITIIDVPFNHDGSLSDKCKLLFPIDVLISTSRQYSLHDKKMLKLQSYASKTLILENQYELSKYSNKIQCNDDGIFLRCTTSGTTDTPKVITHTHGFFTELIKRNSSMYYGNMAMIANLNHGSSPATYFLPGLVSENVTNFFHIPYKLDDGTDRLVKTLEKLKSLGHDIQHIMFPYTHKIDEFLNSNHTFEHCNIYTLSYIKKDWIKYINDKKIKDIVSIFGTNETSGPLMLNYGSDTNFSETSYKAIDNFYKLQINSKNELEVNVPIYNRLVNTKDKFSFENNNYTHLGRSNFYRINDLELDLDMYNSICQNYLNGEFIIDNANNSIYLLLNDEKFDIVKITDLNIHIKKISNNLHFICKYGYIRKLEFMTGIKLDRQLIRSHFRNMVSQNTLL